jgi:hypothetical protein
MKKHVIVLALAVILLLVPALMTRAAVPLPFGGLVTAVTPCDEGLLTYVLTPLTGVIPLMWLWGELPFLMYIPPHPGQELLGWTATVPIPCTISGIPYNGGLPILMHGSSI